MSHNDMEVQSLLFATLVQKQSAFEAQAQKSAVLAMGEPIKSEYSQILSNLATNNSDIQDEHNLDSNLSQDLKLNSSLHQQSNLMKQVLELKHLMPF